MARINGNRGPEAFRPEDEIDEVFGKANPNPDRIGCPGADVLRAASAKALPMDHPVYEHLAACSPCYQDLRCYQQAHRSVLRWRPTLAAAAGILIAVVGGVYGARSLGIGPWRGARDSTAMRALLIDYRGVGTTRSEAGDPAHPRVELPRANLAATILLPIGSELGHYELRLVDGSGKARLSTETDATLRDFAVRIAVNLDLRGIPRGPYSLEFRRVGEEWDPHPVLLR